MERVGKDRLFLIRELRTEHCKEGMLWATYHCWIEFLAKGHCMQEAYIGARGD